MTRRPPTALFGLVALLLSACSGDAPQDTAQQPRATETKAAETDTTETASPSRSPTATETAPAQPTEEATDAAVGQWSSCEHPDGITVEYPQDWHVNDGGTLPPCSAFDPQPLDVPEAQDFFDAGVLLSVEPVPFSRVAGPHAQSGEEISRRDKVVDGHDAVRVETEAQGDAMLAAGTRSTRWIVVLGRERTLTMVTHETGSAGQYKAHRQVLDEMVSRLDLPANR